MGELASYKEWKNEKKNKRGSAGDLLPCPWEHSQHRFSQQRHQPPTGNAANQQRPID